MALVLLAGCAGPAPPPPSLPPRADAAAPARDAHHSGADVVRSDAGADAATTSQDAPPATTLPAVSDLTLPVRPETVWLQKIGVGPGQTARVCARAGEDAVTRTLCAKVVPELRGLGDLYRALGLDQRESPLVGVTTHSLSLAGRAVSALNPRVLVARKLLPEAGGGVVATAFARGEQSVELASYDAAAADFTFYLLTFEQACNRTRCTPADLLSEAIERDWTAWTLYRAEDLVDTGLDCLSCHQPEGARGRRRFLMRQMTAPWMHWSGRETFMGSCLAPDGASGLTRALPSVLAALARGQAPGARYAAWPIDDLLVRASGHDFSGFLELAALTAGQPATDSPVLEPHVFPSQQVLDDELCRGDRTAWAGYRADVLAQGFPVPFHDFDVLDPSRGAAAAADFAAFLGRNAAADALELGASLMSDEAARAVGFVPEAGSTDRQLLRQMCVRCHNDLVDPGLGRARFNVDALERGGVGVSAAERTLAAQRIALPHGSPLVMPPLRAGVLPLWAAERLRAFVLRGTP